MLQPAILFRKAWPGLTASMRRPNEGSEKTGLQKRKAVQSVANGVSGDGLLTMSYVHLERRSGTIKESLQIERRNIVLDRKSMPRVQELKASIVLYSGSPFAKCTSCLARDVSLNRTCPLRARCRDDAAPSETALLAAAISLNSNNLRD